MIATPRFIGCSRRRNLSGMELFRKKPDPRETIRQSKREMTNAARGMDREIAALQSEEKKLLAEIKRTAKTGNQAATRILARQLVTLRQRIEKLHGSRAQIRGVAIHTQSAYASTSVATGIKSASNAMKTIHKTMDPGKQMKVMQEFQKQSAQMEMTSEMLSDVIDDTLDDEETEEEVDDLTSQVLDEIGVDVASKLTSAPTGRIATKKRNDAESSEVEELEKRLAALRNPSS